MGDEVAVRVHGVFPLPKGIEREDRVTQKKRSSEKEMGLPNPLPDLILRASVCVGISG